MAKSTDDENLGIPHPDTNRARMPAPLGDSSLVNVPTEPLKASDAVAKGAVLRTVSRPPDHFKRVPLEVFHRILAFASVTPDGHAVIRQAIAPGVTGLMSTVGSVSRTWNKVAKAVLVHHGVVVTNNIWYEDDITPEEIEHRVLSVMNSKQLKSKPLTLQLGPADVSLDEDAASLPSSIIVSCISGFDVRSLVITSISVKDLASVEETDLLPRLKRLVLKLQSDELATMQEPIPMFKGARMLTHVILLRSPLSTPWEGNPNTLLGVDLPWPQLTHVMENDRDWDLFFPAVIEARNFDNLTFLVIRMVKHIEEVAFVALPPLVFPLLESLIIQATPQDPDCKKVPGFQLLSHLTMEKLKHLGLVGHTIDFGDEKWGVTDMGGSQFLAVLATLKQLTSLSLSFPDIPVMPLRGLHTAMKHIKELDVHVTKSKDAYTDLFAALEVKDGQVDPLFPKLQSFTFDVTNEGHIWPGNHIQFTRDNLFDPIPVKDFIASRRRSDLPSDVARLQSVIMYTDWGYEKMVKMDAESRVGENIFCTRHLSGPDYWHLRRGWQQDRWLERTKGLEGEYEAKQMFPTANLYG
ncbi:hypothetical protein NMY22_g19644 [Coprinellus aureogranulatus]|nr:hypothetical protein NMY22_g19644 [Coprinellus aureogranulatus]